MLQLLRYLWDDTFSYPATAGILIGTLVVALVAKFMQLSPEQRELISGELQDHLQLRVEDLMDEGVPKSDAISQAVEEFDDAAVMAKNFQTVHKLKRRR